MTLAQPQNVAADPGGGRLLSPIVAVGLALALLAASFALAVHNEQRDRAEKLHQVGVQADILAASVAAALAFDDRKATQEYVDALRANPQIEAAGAYDASGKLAAGFSLGPPPLPATNAVAAPVIKGDDLVVTAPVIEGGTRLGSVYLRTSTETWAQRAVRYVGIALVVIMASLLVAALGWSYASVSAAHRRLQRETEGRRKAEEALRQSQKMEAMGQLTGGVAHDFNNLLMVASSGLELMDRTTDPVRRERLKNGIRQAIDRGASLTQQLLAFARRSPLSPEVLDLGARLRGMHDLLDRSLREDVSVSVHVADDLWRVEADPSQLEVALLNIALNARDAMPTGGTIVITAENVPANKDRDGEEAADMVRLSIRDSGVGIAPEMIPRLFEPFFTTKDVGQGTGLGLSQVYGFARSSGGDVDMVSRPGEGATVTLMLPRSMKPEAAGPVRPAPPAGRPDREYRVLLVEDDDAVADLVVEMLHELGYAAIRASTAAEGLATLNGGGTFDLVFSDMVMPGKMDGMDLARAVRARWPTLPIVLTTGYSTAASQAAAHGLRLLVKPYQIDALAAELQAALKA